MWFSVGSAGWFAAAACFDLVSASVSSTFQRDAEHQQKRQDPATNTACAVAASAASSYLAAIPTATDLEIPANIAHDCLQSIPNRPGPAIDLLNTFEAILEFQSDKDTWLLNPPEGFLFPGLDIDKYMQTIRQNVLDGNYDSEYDFQLDIQTMLLDARDGHLFLNPDATVLFSFLRPIQLASVSADGIDLPQIYVLSDLVSSTANQTQLSPNTDYSPSPVKLINDIDALTFLLSECLIGNSQDPDALYNSQFFQLAKTVTGEPSIFQQPHFYPGDTTNITFLNGTTRISVNKAVVNVDLAGIQNGDDAYEAFCDIANKHPNVGKKSKRQSSDASTPLRLPFYPEPIISHPDGVVSGYYLSAPFDDVAVLAVYSFEPESIGGELEFQQVVQAFLRAAVDSDKRKLIVDLQGNGGGFVDLGLDLVGQLFPSLKPDVKSNMRTSLGLKLLVRTSAAIYEGDIGNPDLNETEIDLAETIPFSYQSVMTPNGDNFPSLKAFYGPVTNHGGEFTAYFQNNYSDSHQSDILGEGIIVTGTNNRTGFLQPFAARDIIMLHDGFCASTCTTFSEHLKNLAKVQSITVGGRPQIGPAQGVGGVKGAQLFPLTSFLNWVQIFNSSADSNYDLAKGTVFENFTDLAYQRADPNSPGGVNGRNSFRIGDETSTPLQYVYEASDCRLWWTHEMLYDPTFLWQRVAELAFRNRTGTKFVDSPFCIQDSTTHGTSISGGWEQGTLGPQTPPSNAKLQDKGWVVNGTTITIGGPAEEHDPVVVAQQGDAGTDQINSTVPASQPQIHKSQAVTDACNAWHGDLWLVKMICAALSYRR